MLVETPIAPTRAMADVMIAAADRNRVALEIAENYYRQPVERLKSAVIAAGAIGTVSRLHRIFHEGGYHGMSLLRHHAGGEPTSVLGIAHESPVMAHAATAKAETNVLDLTVIDASRKNGSSSCPMAVSIFSRLMHWLTIQADI